jgi:hypothetical protein
VIIGQTVFYRLTFGEAAKVNKWREEGDKFRAVAGPENPVGLIVHFGDPVKGGELLPAEVVRIYSALERTHIDPDFSASSEVFQKTFSGIADLRIHLPGNDVLWVPCAHIDLECQSHTGKGLGVTMLPKYGKFTTVPPAELLD